MPTEEVSDFIEQRSNHFEGIETAAEELWRDNGISLHTLHHDLIRVLTQKLAVQVEIVPTARMPGFAAQLQSADAAA